MARRWRIEDVPIDYRDRPEGSYSKLSTFGDGAKVLRAITSLFKDYRPLAFFGWLALILLATMVGMVVLQTIWSGLAALWRVIQTLLL